MNKLIIGSADKTEQLLETREPFLLIDDGELVDAFLENFSATVFKPKIHSFNPLDGIDYKGARDFAATIYAASPQGENTLTVRNGKRALARLFLANPTRLDKLPNEDEEATATIQDLLLSPLLKRVLCRNPNFRFEGSVIAKLDRAVIGDFDAFVLGQLLIGQFKGQVILSDSGFYLRDFNMNLIRQNRLTVGLTSLSELSHTLQQAVLGIKDKTIYRTTMDDAERLVIYTRHANPSILALQGEGEFLCTS